MRILGLCVPTGMVKYYTEWGQHYYEYEFIDFLCKPHEENFEIEWIDIEDNMFDDWTAEKAFNDIYDYSITFDPQFVEFAANFDLLWALTKQEAE